MTKTSILHGLAYDYQSKRGVLPNSADFMSTLLLHVILRKIGRTLLKAGGFRTKDGRVAAMHGTGQSATV